MRKRIISTLCALCCMTLISGCMVGPEYNRPTTAIDDTGVFENQPEQWKTNEQTESIGHWWERFGDAYLNEAVSEALANNNDLRTAAWRVMENQALLAQSFGARLPVISYEANRTEQSLVPRRDKTINFDHDLTIVWVADLFGKLRRTERAAINDLLGQEETQKALVHSIIAQTVKSRIEISTQQRLVDIATRNMDSRKNTLEIVERRYNSGLVMSLDLHQAKENYAAAAATKPGTKQNLELAMHTLDVLLGRRAGTGQMPTDMLPEIERLEPVPMGLPISLLDRRPDVKAAERQLEAATERVGVSIAELYPDLTFTGIVGTTGSKHQPSLDPANIIYSGIASLATPVFAGGQLREGVKAAKARAEQAASNYAETVLNAIREVEDAMVKEKYLTESVGLLKVRVDEAMKAENLARDRYSKGVESLLTVLDTERRRISAENELASAIKNLYNARVDLYLAIGGDWEVSYEIVSSK